MVATGWVFFSVTINSVYHLLYDAIKPLHSMRLKIIRNLLLSPPSFPFPALLGVENELSLFCAISIVSEFPSNSIPLSLSTSLEDISSERWTKQMLKFKSYRTISSDHSILRLIYTTKTSVQMYLRNGIDSLHQSRFNNKTQVLLFLANS